METSPPPVKKLRAMQLTECVREFTLPQQFPSRVTPTEKSIVLKSKNNICENNITNITNITNIKNLTTTKSVQLLPSKNTQAGNNLQKLRIKLPNGKDLGEVNVKLLSQDSSILSRKSLFIKQDAFKNVSKLPVLPVINSEGSTTKIPCKSQLETVNQTTGNNVDENKVLVNVSHPFKIQKNDGESKRIFMRNKPLILARKSISGPKRIHESKEDRTDTGTIHLQNQPCVVQMQSQVELANISNFKNVKPKFIKLSANLHAPKLFIMGSNDSGLNSNAEEPCKASNIESTGTDSKSVKEQKMTNPKSMLIKKDKMCLSVGKSSKETCQISRNSTEGKVSQTASCKENNDMLVTADNNTTSIVNIDGEQNEEQENSSRNKNSVDLLSTTNGMSLAVTNSLIVNKGKLGKNVMVVVHDNGPNLLGGDSNMCDQNSSQSNTRKDITSHSHKRLEDNSISQEKIDCGKNIDNCQLQETQSHSEIQDEGSNSTPSSQTESSEENLIQRRNILEKALNSVQDEDLRMQALKALAACGIITERYVPKQPPLDKKLVHDTEVQTTIFGILEKDSFISVSEKEPNVRRVPLKESPVVNLMIDSLSEPLIRDTLVSNQDDDDLNHYLNIFAKDFLKDNEGACQIKEVLTKPNQRSVNIATQLQKDFDTALQYNEEGLLNIHKAVIEDRIHDVQRHVMILKGRKESVDIRTEDGMSSLELGLIYGVSPDTLHLLLEAGAQPAFEETGHESAILIASRKRSPLLTLLLRYVTNKKSLDILDSMGFSALHYCARYGDLEGVKALISAGADVNLKDGRSGRTALFHAVEHKRFTIAQKLLDNGAFTNIPNFSGQTVLSLVDDIKSLSFRASLTKAAK